MINGEDMNRIINYHGIKNSSWFEDTLIILKSRYNMVSIDEIEDFYYNRGNLKNACHITFDDGDISFYNMVYPILKRHNIPATIFVSPNMCLEKKNFWFQEIVDYNYTEMKKIISEYLQIELKYLKQYSISAILKCLSIAQIWEIIEIYKKHFGIPQKDPQNISVDQLLELEKSGLIKIGAHTINHPILANENDDNSEKEIIGSFQGLQEILGHEIKYFAYPNGYPNFDFGQREINILKNMNCKIAFSCEPGSFDIKNNTLSINRLGFSHGSKIFIRLKLLLGEYWDYIKESILKSEIEVRIELDKKILLRSTRYPSNSLLTKSFRKITKSTR
jgi:peptidoglycan/xylan/chitin deacetylase (PgdA/CDA1 family)